MADGPDSSSFPERLAPSDDDDEFESFFRAGEEGTYKEGPSQSLAPVYADVDFDEPEEDFYERHEVQLERRDRYRRYVSRGVGSLGAGLVLALAVRALGFHDSRDAVPALASPALASPAPAATEAAASVVGPVPESPPAVQNAAVETFEEVIVTADSPAPAAALPKAAPKTAPPKALPAPIAAAPKAVPQARPSHPKPAVSAAPPPKKSLPLSGLQVVSAPASPIFAQTPQRAASP